jgi:putative ABC transport system permease protein
MLNDLRFALRMLVTHRWFSLAVVVTLALGIGINTTVFTLVNAVLFKPVPVPGGERLVTVSNQDSARKGRNSWTGVSLPDYREFKAQNRTFEALEAYSGTQITISEQNNPPDRFRGAKITPGLFSMLRTAPIVGRGFSEADAKAGTEVVALLGHGVWQTRYGGARDVVGRAVRLNGQPATIIGVMPEGFRFPQNEDAWIPLVPAGDLEKRGSRPLQLFGLLKPGTPIERASADLAVIGQRLAQEFPDTNKNLTPGARTFHDTYNGDQIRMVFLTMLGAVGFVLLIACANVANMMLSRAVARSREISVRVAMGATRWQIVRQLLIESVLLSCLGGILGLGLAAFGVHLFDLATQDVGKPYWIEFTMDWRAFGYFAAVSVLSGILFGLVPALRASRVDLNTALKDGTAAAGSHRGGTLTATLVVLQFALTVVLLAGAGMMVRSFFAAQTVNPFVRAGSILTARIQLPEDKGERYTDAVARRQFQDKLLVELAALPGVTHAAITSSFPGLGSSNRDIEVEDHPNENPERLPRASFVVQTPNYLPTIGLPILTGRGFNEIDGEAGKEAAVVTREFAAKYWPEGSAVGKRFRFIQNKKPGPWMSVIGICGDIVQEMQERDTPAPPLVFISNRQEAWGWNGVLLRTTADPAALAATLRATVQKIDQDLPLFDVRTLNAALDRQRWFLAVFGSLFLVFALAGLLMASVGIYAVVAHATARRTREIGVRMALGATAANIMRLVLSRGMTQLAIGLAIGLAGAFGATRLMKSIGFLMQVSPNDPLVFTAITTLLVGIGAFACWLPARRAARLDPTQALRVE